MNTTEPQALKTLRFGIEIETVGCDRLTLANKIAAAIGGAAFGHSSSAGVRLLDGRNWTIVHDGSLNGSRNGEIVSPILTYADLEMVQQVVRAAREAGAKADSSCGIHIHVDGAAFDAKSLTNLIKIVAKQERLLEHALQVRPDRLARYCRSIDDRFLAFLDSKRNVTMAQIREAWYGGRLSGGRYDQSRYRGLNLNSMFFRGTIEYRYFNGSLHAGEVKSFIQLVLAMSAKALKAKSASSKRRAFSASTAKYDFRVFLLGLGLIGDEFKTCRHHMLKGLEGSAAWKNGRPAPAAPAAAPSEEG